MKVTESSHIRDLNTLKEAEISGGTNFLLMAKSMMTPNYLCPLVSLPLVLAAPP